MDKADTPNQQLCALRNMLYLLPVVGVLTACQYCRSTSACNDVIGCDECAPGKQQPDCAQGM